MGNSTAGRSAILKSGAAAVVAAVTMVVASAQPQRTATATKLTPPKEQFGHDIGDDYYLVNYTQYVEYLQQAATASPIA